MSTTQMAGGGWAAKGMTEQEKAQHLANAQARADDVTATNRAMRRMSSWLAAAGAAALIAASGVLISAIWSWKPAEPVYARIDGDGRVTAMMRAVDAPMSFTEGTSRQYLRMYLDVCEPYRYEAERVLTPRCELLLSPEQQERYATEYASQRAKFGRTGSVSVADNVTYTPMGSGGRMEIWSVRFCRIEFLNGQAALLPWQATLTFAWRPDLKMSEADRSWNLAGMQIINRTSQADTSTSRCS